MCIRDSRKDAFALCLDRIKILRDRIYSAGMEKFRFCPETMGKINQIGSLDEIIELCAVDKIFLPAIDFGHLNARTTVSYTHLKGKNKRARRVYMQIRAMRGKVRQI